MGFKGYGTLHRLPASQTGRLLEVIGQGASGSDENIGQCWDFAFDELDDILALLERLRMLPAEVYSE